MASFTMELKNVIQACNGDIGLKDYPIFDESHREILNKKIIDHYYMREISMSSIDEWLLVLNRTMREIMPEYNQLYKSELLKFNPLLSMDMKTISDSLNESDSESVSNGTSNTDSSSEQLANQQTGTDTTAKARVVNSTTPQQRLAGNMDYASGGTDTTSDTNTDVDVTSSDTASSTVDATTNATATGKNKDKGHGESHVQGYSGSPSALLLDFRATILNIDLMVIERLSDLFMMIWSNGDQYTNNYFIGGIYNGYRAII